MAPHCLAPQILLNGPMPAVSACRQQMSQVSGRGCRFLSSIHYPCPELGGVGSPLGAWKACSRPCARPLSRLGAKNSGASDDSEENQSDAGIRDAMEKVLQSEESKALLQDLAAAVERVENAKKAMSDLGTQEKAIANERALLESAQSLQEILAAADANVVECEGAVEAAEDQLKAAERNLVNLRAGRLNPNGKWAEGPVDEDAERLESGKAAAVSAIAGTLASLPLAYVTSTSSGGGLDVGGLLLDEASVVLSCALFGVCFRYIVRRDVYNAQLQGGAMAAFGLTRGLALVDGSQLASRFDFELAVKSAVDVGGSLLGFAFAGVALAFCLRENLLQPFPMRKT